jgi:hypothetical protein
VINNSHCFMEGVKRGLQISIFNEWRSEVYLFLHRTNQGYVLHFTLSSWTLFFFTLNLELVKIWVHLKEIRICCKLTSQIPSLGKKLCSSNESLYVYSSNRHINLIQFENKWIRYGSNFFDPSRIGIGFRSTWPDRLIVFFKVIL